MAKIFFLHSCIICLAAPLAAQVFPFADSAAFGGSKIFSELNIPSSRDAKQRPLRGFIALGFAQGEQGGDKFFSSLFELSSNDPNTISNAMLEISQASWGMRSRAFGLAMNSEYTTIAYTREEMTSLWADAIDDDAIGFDVRRSVLDRVSITSAGMTESGNMFYGGTIRFEKRGFGGERHEIELLSPAEHFAPKSLLDYNDTQSRNTTYALDAFIGVEIANSLRLAINANRLASRSLWDVEEKPQFRAGAQVNIGALAKLIVEADINETMRMPFPVMQKSEGASLKITANSLITFAIGVEKKTIDGQQMARAGLNVWLTGKKNHLGAGFQFGEDKTTWGATWRKVGD